MHTLLEHHVGQLAGKRDKIVIGNDLDALKVKDLAVCVDTGLGLAHLPHHVEVGVCPLWLDDDVVF